MDKGYDSGEVRDLVKEFGYTAHIRSRGEEAQAIKRQGSPLGCGACAQLDEPVPPHPEAVGKET